MFPVFNNSAISSLIRQKLSITDQMVNFRIDKTNKLVSLSVAKSINYCVKNKFIELQGTMYRYILISLWK